MDKGLAQANRGNIFVNMKVAVDIQLWFGGSQGSDNFYAGNDWQIGVEGGLAPT